VTLREVTSQVSTVPSPASTADAIKMVLTGLSHLAATDPTAMAAQAQAECLQALEQGDAISAAARARILAAFTAGRGYCADADYSPTSWLIHRTRITKGTARAHLAWARCDTAHPQVVAALAEGTVLSESMARTICGWTDKLPVGCRATADDILIAAARAGARKEDLAGLAAEIYARSLSDEQDDGDSQLSFEDRKVRVETTFGGAGVVTGDLTPGCAAVVIAVLESLSAPLGAEDTRTRAQRYHDALEDAMRRLVASGLLPERAGQPVKLWGHVSLAELRALDDGSVLQDQWIGEMAVRWAAHRAAASETGSDGAAWLDGTSAGAVACDATIIPVVTGQVDPAALDDLVSLCLKFAATASAADHHSTRTRLPSPARQPPSLTRRPPSLTRRPPSLARRPIGQPRQAPPAAQTRSAMLTCPARGRLPRRRWRCSATPSSGRPSTWSPARAAWPPSCAPGSWVPGCPVPACRWTSGTAPRSPPPSAAR
jgi:hypothetical protein